MEIPSERMCNSKILDAAEKKASFFSLDSTKSIAKNCFTSLGVGAAYSYLALKIIEPILLSGLDFCPNLPNAVYKYASHVCKVNSNFFLGNTQDSMTISAPFVETLIIQVGLQEVLLKKLPRALFSKISTPEKINYFIDSQVSKIARVLISAVAFSLAHAMPPSTGWPNCSTARLVSTFVMGLGLAALQESSGNALYTFFAHAGNNLTPGYLLKYMGVSLSCPA